MMNVKYKDVLYTMYRSSRHK